ncbi:hypothetical protein IAU60_002590 [Kwoniella sp. DSM 27419]
MSSSAPTDLYIFTTAQTALPVRYARPRKPILNLPSLVHRTLHTALDGEPASILYVNQEEGSRGWVIIPHPDTLVKHDLPSAPHNSTARPASNTIEQPQRPQVNGEVEGTEGLSDGSANYLIDAELTVKLHLVAEAGAEAEGDRARWVDQALSMLESHKGLDRHGIDTLLLGFKGVDYRGSKTAASEMFGCGSEGLEAPNTESVTPELEREILSTWRSIESTVGQNTKLGSLYAPLGLLQKLVDLRGDGSRGASVNALDTPDCHHLPKEYTGYAKQNGVELWAGGGGEGSDPLPSADLHNLLSEFVPKISRLGGVQLDTSKLEKIIPMRDDNLKFDEGVERGVSVKWVLSYTLVSKTRNVVKDKGYIVAAQLSP